MESSQLAALVADQEGALLRFAFLISGSKEDAEDLVQKTYLKLLKAPDRAITFPAAYARRILLNQFRTDLRSKARPAVLDAPLTTPSFEQDVVLRSWIWQELHRLSPRQRAVLVLRYYEGLHDEEIARILHCRRASVRSLAARAVSQLRTSCESALLLETHRPHEQRDHHEIL